MLGFQLDGFSCFFFIFFSENEMKGESVGKPMLVFKQLVFMFCDLTLHYFLVKEL